MFSTSPVTPDPAAYTENMTLPATSLRTAYEWQRRTGEKLGVTCERQHVTTQLQVGTYERLVGCYG